MFVSQSAPPVHLLLFQSFKMSCSPQNMPFFILSCKPQELYTSRPLPLGLRDELLNFRMQLTKHLLRKPSPSSSVHLNAISHVSLEYMFLFTFWHLPSDNLWTAHYAQSTVYTIYIGDIIESS